jgi:hypothetical protein
VKIRSNRRLILSTSLIDHDRIIGSIESSNQSWCITPIDQTSDRIYCISLIDRDRVRSISLDTMKVRSSGRLILSTSPIDHDRIIGSIKYLIDPSVLL